MHKPITEVRHEKNVGNNNGSERNFIDFFRGGVSSGIDIGVVEIGVGAPSRA